MGTLYTCALSRMRDFQSIAVKYFIVLRPGKVSVHGLRHRPDLAPSSELFFWTQNHKHEPDWFQTYEAWFKKDLKERPGLRLAVDKLEKELNDHDVLLVCFCPDPAKCHRRLIAEELQNRGIKVHIQ